MPEDTARELDRDLEAVPKMAAGGKTDFHALRVSYVTFVLESGANPKEAQALARHATPPLTMNVYARARSERLSEVTEKVGEVIQPQIADAFGQAAESGGRGRRRNL